MSCPSFTGGRRLPLIVVPLLVLAAGPLAADDTEELFLLQDIAAVNAQELATHRGRADLNVDDVILQLSEVTANASVSNNSLDSNMTGANLVETGAFDGAAGVIFAVQNTGNHVIIQNTTLINVTMNP